MKLSLPWKWFLGLAILLVDLLLVIYFAIRITLPPYLARQIQADLKRDAIIVRDVFESQLAAPHPDFADINRLSHDLSKRTGLRITVIAPDGTVIGESDKPEDELGNIENHLQRPEVEQAIQDGFGRCHAPQSHHWR